MKRKNLKSVIHNFAYSFPAYDYHVSQHQLLPEICELYKNYSISHIEVNFISGEISPGGVRSKNVQQLVVDYIDWLPQLCASQNVDAAIIKKLFLRVDFGFDSASVYKNSRNERVIEIKTAYNYTDDRGNSDQRVILENEIIKKQKYEKC